MPYRKIEVRLRTSFIIVAMVLCSQILLPISDAYSQTSDFSGNWSGSWSSIYGGSGGVVAVINQSGTTISGTLSLTNTICGNLSNISLTGVASGDTVSLYAKTYVCGATSEIKFTNGVLSGNIINGSYLRYDNGVLSDGGSFTMSRPSVVKYTLTVSKVGNGTVTSSSGINCGADCSESYNSGTYVTLAATPGTDSIFAGWSGSGCSGSGNCTLAMDSTKSVTATFSTKTYNITIPSVTNGTIICDKTTVNHGSSSICTITPSTGYHVADVIVDGTSVGAVTTYTFSNVTANHSISAAFAVNTYAISTSGGTNGAITPSSNTNYGSNKTISITPNAGYHVADVIVDGTLVGAVTTYTFSNVTANHSISAAFAVNTYAISTSGGTNGTITPSSNANYGSNKVISITPDVGYHVADVIVDGASVGAVTTYTFSNITSNHSISATFAVNTFTCSITKAGTGSGTVLSVPSGINCGNYCGASYNTGTSVELTATPAPKSTFTGWSGGECTGVGKCVVAISKNIKITASFASPQGNLNSDEEVDIEDAILSMQVLCGVKAVGREITMAADVNADGKIGIAETIYILQKEANMR